jgi:gas vesicle protein
MRRRRVDIGPIPIFAIGVAVGAAMALLFAPKSGDQTREDISANVRKKIDKAAAKGREWKQQAQEAAELLKERIQGATEAGKRAYEDELRSVSGRADYPRGDYRL